VSIIAGASIVSSLIILPFLIEGSTSLFQPRFALLIEAGLQLISALPSVIAMQRYFGDFPPAPNKIQLRKHRLGSLLKYREILEPQAMKS
jgi:hypothetical protein